MLAFLRGEADVLVATSIIESGIDIPQANTLIVERADHFGLAQLYQIRGRVGRSRERAYAYLLYPVRGRAHARRGAAPVGAVGLHRAGRRLQGRDARPRAARRRQPARRRAVRPRRRARLRAVHADARRGGRGDGRRGRRCERRARAGPPRRQRRRLRARPTTSPTSRRRSTCTAASPGRARSRSCTSCAPSWRTASARCPSRCDNLLLLQQARIKLGEAGARAVSFRGGRLAVTPIELDSRRAKRMREEIPEALYESGKSQLSMRVPDDPAARFPAVVRAADVLLAVTREAA